MSEAIATPSVRFMGSSGHFILTWDPQSDGAAEALIRKKMNEGFVFRIMGRGGVFGSQSSQPVPVRQVSDIHTREVYIDDPDIQAFVNAGLGRVSEDTALDEQPETPPMPRARDAREAAQHDTIAHRPLRGG